MIQPKKMLRECAATVWNVPSAAVQVVDVRRGSKVAVSVVYATKEILATGKTLELAQYALARRLHRRIARLMVRQARLLAKHKGQHLPHRFDGLPVPLPEDEYELIWLQMLKQRGRRLSVAHTQAA